MRQVYLRPVCARCAHPASPRSQVCDVCHPRCTANGCILPIDPAPHHAALEPMQTEEAVRAAASGTLFLVDVASYQAGISLAAVQAAGFGAVNVKLSQGNWYTHTAAGSYVDAARALGMAVSTFSWIDNSASGAEQAAYAYRAMQAAGGPDGMAHQVDCEDTAQAATYTIWRDYVSWWQDKLGRHVTAYTGDWWWQPRGWDGAALTPYLWAPPNSGYLAAYPGDTSSAWRAGYGGWDTLSLLQYAVSPITNAGGGALSKTAIRDPAVWAALTGRKPVPGPTTGGDHMLFLTHINGQPAVCDGMRCRIVTDEDVANLRYLATHGSRAGLPPALQLGNGGEFWDGYTNAFGVVVDESAPPFAALTDAQAAQIAAAVVARPDNPLGPADEPAIVAAVVEAARRMAGGPAAA